MTSAEAFLNHCKELKAKHRLNHNDCAWINACVVRDETAETNFTVEQLLDVLIEQFTLRVIKDRLTNDPQTFQAPIIQPKAFREI